MKTLALILLLTSQRASPPWSALFEIAGPRPPVAALAISTRRFAAEADPEAAQRNDLRGPPGFVTLVAQDSPRHEIERKLESMKITVDFANTPIGDAVAFVRDFTNLNIVIDPRATDGARNTVSLKVKDLSVKSALKLMLAGCDCTAVYREGAIVVVRKEDAKTDVTLQIYDVRDLVMVIRDFPGPTIDLKGPQRGPGIIVSGWDEPAPPHLPCEFIVDLIQQTCGSWDDDRCSVSFANGLLVVSQTRDTHARIQTLLQKLRQYR